MHLFVACQLWNKYLQESQEINKEDTQNNCVCNDYALYMTKYIHCIASVRGTCTFNCLFVCLFFILGIFDKNKLGKAWISSDVNKT